MPASDMQNGRPPAAEPPASLTSPAVAKLTNKELRKQKAAQKQKKNHWSGRPLAGQPAAESAPAMQLAEEPMTEPQPEPTHATPAKMEQPEQDEPDEEQREQHGQDMEQGAEEQDWEEDEDEWPCMGGDPDDNILDDSEAHQQAAVGAAEVQLQH